jgi:hypothetical protein
MEFGFPQLGIGPAEPGAELPNLMPAALIGAGSAGSGLSPAGGQGSASAAKRRREGELLVERIAVRMQRRVRGLTVSVHDDHTLVVARAESWHVRQLIEQAVMKEIEGEVRFDVQVGS